MLDRRNDADRGLTELRTKDAFIDSVANRRLQKIPGLGDLPADVDPRRVDRIDDRSKAKPQISCGRLQGSERFTVARSRFCDQRLDCELRLLNALRSTI